MSVKRNDKSIRFVEYEFCRLLELNSLYPPIEPYARHRIAVDQGHSVYVEECGNRDGMPALFLHGGPGSGCRQDHRRYFNPSRYRIVLVDQRGSGRSTPRGAVSGNNTQRLCADLESIRIQLEIDRWLVFGGSWGVALGLYYAQSHPHAVAGMILRGSFLAREQDLDWFISEQGVARIFPENAARLLAPLSPTERADPVSAYYHHVHEVDPETTLPWARAWAAWGDRVATWNLRVSEDPQDDHVDLDKLVDKVRIETHFAHHRYFLRDSPLLEGMSKLPDVPITILHGRRDLTCPVEAAWTLHRAIPGSSLHVIPDAGHLAGEPPMVDALVGYTDRMSKLLT